MVVGLSVGVLVDRSVDMSDWFDFLVGLVRLVGWSWFDWFVGRIGLFWLVGRLAG